MFLMNHYATTSFDFHTLHLRNQNVIFHAHKKSDLRFIINGDWQARCLNKESHFQLKSSKKYFQVSSIAILKLLFVPHNKKRERKNVGAAAEFRGLA